MIKDSVIQNSEGPDASPHIPYKKSFDSQASPLTRSSRIENQSPCFSDSSNFVFARTYVKKTNIELYSFSPRKFEEILELDDINFDDLMHAL